MEKEVLEHHIARFTRITENYGDSIGISYNLPINHLTKIDESGFLELTDYYPNYTTTLYAQIAKVLDNFQKNIKQVGQVNFNNSNIINDMGSHPTMTYQLIGSVLEKYPKRNSNWMLSSKQMAELTKILIEEETYFKNSKPFLLLANFDLTTLENKTFREDVHYSKILPKK